MEKTNIELLFKILPIEISTFVNEEQIRMKLEEEKNKDAIKMAWASLEAKVRKNKLGGGKERLKKLEEKNSKITSTEMCELKLTKKKLKIFSHPLPTQRYPHIKPRHIKLPLLNYQTLTPIIKFLLEVP